MKSRLDIWQSLLADAGRRCSVSTTRDLNTVTSRVKSEGEEFFTLTLPQFAKDLEWSLEEGCIPGHAFAGFRRTLTRVKVTQPHLDGGSKTKKGWWGPPAFLGGFLDLIFDSEWVVTWDEYNTAIQVVSNSGLRNHSFFPPMLRNPERGSEEEARMADAIQAVRQLCLAFSKERAMPATKVVAKAVESYVEVDKELGGLLEGPKGEAAFAATPDVVRAASLAYGDVFLTLDRLLADPTERLSPQHGSGATADRFYGNQKWHFRTWHNRLEHLFPFVEYGLPSYGWFDDADQVQFLSEPEESPGRLTAIPKTAKTPRLITAEPVCMQYVQQALARPLVEGLERDPLSRRLVGFTDQVPNQQLACRGSIDGSLATLDLSEASDRVSNWLVGSILERYPHLSEAVGACRTRRVQLPDGRVIPIVKFASMGSALTFPIEAIVFSSIVLASMARASHQPLTRGFIARVSSSVRVYGDDIIVPADMAESVIEDLEVFGLKVNRNKSFWNGDFRESCGKEYWRGYDVTYVKVRKALPASRRHVDRIVTSVKTRNLFYKTGYTETAEAFDRVLAPLLWGHYPYVLETSPILGRVNGSTFYQIDDIDPDLHAPCVKGWVANPKIPRNEIDGVPALMKCFVEAIGNPDMRPDHLKRSGRPRDVSINLVMGSPF